MLLDDEKSDDGFFEQGPGFGGNVRPPASNNHQELAAPAAVELQSRHRDSSFGFNRRDDGLKQHHRSPPKVIPTMRPIDSAFGSGRAIIFRNPMKILADFIKMRGSVPFASLPDDDQVLVNYSKHVFKVFTTQPGDMQVRLVDPEIDTMGLIFDEKKLRNPVESDLRWMWEQGVQAPNHRCLVKPVMFVAPRGFLVVAAEDEEDGESAIVRMELILRARMRKAPFRNLKLQNVRPGMLAVYVYQEDREIHYYRVLILGSAHKQDDIMVLLVDYEDQYCVDVLFCQLFALPKDVGFEVHAPRVYFAVIHGVHGMSETEQEVMWKNVDDEDRKNFVVAVFNAEKEKVLSVDVVWKDEYGDFQWLSQIARRRGAVMSSDTESMGHLKKCPRSALTPLGKNFFIVFVDPNPGKNELEQKKEVVEPDSRQPALCATPNRHFEAPAAHCSPNHLNTLAMFEKALGDKDYFLVFTLSQFARSLAHHLDDPQWETAVEYMMTEAHIEGIRL